jgi:hypothetical protein
VAAQVAALTAIHRRARTLDFLFQIFRLGTCNFGF